jgi:hypothetical protein
VCPQLFSGNGFQRQTFPFFCVLETSTCFSYRNYRLINSHQIHSSLDWIFIHNLKDGLFTFELIRTHANSRWIFVQSVFSSYNLKERTARKYRSLFFYCCLHRFPIPLLTEEFYWVLFYKPSLTISTICWMYYYRSQINWVSKKIVVNANFCLTTVVLLLLA